MKMENRRTAKINRKTAETDIVLTLCLDGAGTSKCETGCGFLDHMLTLFARHGRFDLTVSCKGDRDVDDHHTVEDIGICLGKAFSQAGIALHLRQIAGVNSHHIIEGAFKSAARSLRIAVSVEEAYADEIPSTKGILE